MTATRPQTSRPTASGATEGERNFRITYASLERYAASLSPDPVSV